MSKKTNKSAEKRFKVTKSGKVLHRKGPKNHYRGKKSGDQIRRARSRKELSNTQAKKIKKHYLPHS